MDIGKYTMPRGDAHLAAVTCPDCGAAFVSASSDELICTFCESRFGSEVDTKRADTDRNKLAEIYNAAKSGKWDAALKQSDDLVAKSADALLWYTAGVLYQYCSDAHYMDKDYNLMGYMEQNAGNVYDSLSLALKAKDRFYRSIALLKDALKEGANEQLLHVWFLAEVKVKRKVHAKDALDQLAKLNAKGLAARYDEMVYAVSFDPMPGDAEQKLESLLQGGEPTARFYLAKYLAKTKKLKESASVLRSISQQWYMPMTSILLNRVEDTARTVTGDN